MADLVGLREHRDARPGDPCDRQDGPGGMPCRSLALFHLQIRDAQTGLLIETNACRDHAADQLLNDRESVMTCRPITP